ncbi:MAG: EAL domain-containing protein [Bryobacter sp.]|nr:EAL domain-containing protein [Bryobacter sp. CoA8 C33]
MPILLLSIPGGSASTTPQGLWRETLQRVADAVFSTRSIQETAAIIEECDKLGTPVGLLVLEGMSWTKECGDWVRMLRTRYEQSPVRIIACCCEWTEEGQLDCVDAGVDASFPAPWNWSLIELKARRSLEQAGKILELQTGKRYAERLLKQQQQAAVNQDHWRIDLVRRQIDFSEKFKELTGLEAVDVETSLEECMALIHPLDLARLGKAMSGSDWKALPEELSLEFRLRNRDGAWRWLLLRGRLEKDEWGDAVSISGSHQDITEAKTVDALTGLGNRVGFEQWIEDEFEAQSLSLAVFLVCIDRLALLRDSLGNGVGDQLLRLTGERLVEVLNTGGRNEGSCVVARISEEEFAVALPGIESEENALKIAESMRYALARGIWLQGTEFYLSSSVGYALQEDRRKGEDIWRDAEMALHEAKSLGGNRTVLFDREMRQNVRERLEMESELKRAVEQWEFEVYYQPKVLLSNDRIVGFEALLRWRHPVRGLISPTHFIPLAEETGLIVPIGMRTLEEACRTVRGWQREFPQTPPLEISVNLSVRQFQDRHLIEEVERVLAETGLAASSLHFEVTESVLVQDPEQALDIVKELRRMGAGLKIDDFGTGYSSLSYLHKLPFNTLKIDRSFVSTMMEDRAAFEIVRAIILLAGSLGLHVVAEGVETRKQAENLAGLGCQYGQGYLYSPPMPAATARKMLEAQARQDQKVAC